MREKLVSTLIIYALILSSCGSSARLSRKVNTIKKDYQAINAVLKAKRGGKIILKQTYTLDPSIHREIEVDQLLYINENDSLFYKVTADGKLNGKPLSTISKIGIDRKFGFTSATAAYLTALATGVAITLSADKNFRNSYDYDVLGSFRVPIFTFLGTGLTVGILGLANILHGSPEPKNYIFYTIE